jgi:hypothetical protein
MAADEYSGWDPSFFQSSTALPAPQFLGLTRNEASDLATATGVAEVRVADLDAYPNATLRMDRRRQRLTLLVHRGRVVRAAFF